MPSGRGEVDPPSPSEAVWNSLVESHIMAHSGDGGPLRVEPMMAVSELSLLGESLRQPKQSAMNSRLPMQMVLLREKPLHDRRSLLAAMVSDDDGIVGTSSGKARCKSPSCAPTVSVFYTDKNMVLKNTHSSNDVVLRTTKHRMIYPGSGPSLEVIALRPTI
jgi:hypothetical protein